MISVKYYIGKAKSIYDKDGLSGVYRRVSRIIRAKTSKLISSVFRYECTSIASPVKREVIKSNTSVVYTIVSKNHMQYALTVRESFLDKNPECDFIVFLMDKLMSDEEMSVFNELLKNNVRIIGFDEVSNNVGKTHFNEMLFKFTALEMNVGLKPFAMEYLMNGGYEKVMYIDPDIFFYQKIDKILNQLDVYDILLIPHMLRPYNDDKKPTEIDIMLSGTYNLGFLAVKNTENTLNMVRWWQERLYHFGFSDIKNGMLTEQKGMDFIPSLYEKVCVFKDSGHNVAYWNMHERSIKKIKGEWFVNGEPLVIFNFSGLPLNDLESIYKHQSRHRLKNFPELEPLFKSYAKVVESFEPESFETMKYYYNSLSGSAYQIQDFLRKDYKKIFELTQKPCAPCYENIKLLLNYFHKENRSSLTRYALLLYKSREDLQIAFPNIDSIKLSKKGFSAWYKNQDNVLNTDSVEKMQYGINLIGYFDNIIGVAQVARNFCKLSLSSSLPLSVDIISSPVHHQISKSEKNFYSKYHCIESKLENNLIFINADMVEDYKKHYPRKFENKNNFGIWWWEFDDYFPHVSAFDVIDELIVFTDFIATALKKVAPDNIKINKMPYPFVADWGELMSKSSVREKYNFSENDFIFIFSFDFLSSYERKNPEAILQAFKTAFGSNVDGAKLLFKVINADLKNTDYTKFINLIDKLNLTKEVLIISDSLERDDMISLIRASDVYLSLHRSEGLGLGMLEAMSLGLPVVATAYGGNTEFMNAENSCLVDFGKVKVKEDFGPYKKGWEWGDPNIKHAAEYMLKLYKDRDYKTSVGKKAEKSIKEQYNSNNFTKSLYNLIGDFN